MYRRGKLKKLQAVALLLVCCGMLSYSGVKIVHLPESIKIQENHTKETFVRNLTEEGKIFRAHPLFLIDGYIYIFQQKPVELIKLTLDGKVVARAGREGEGPGEMQRVWAMAEYKGNLAILDFERRRVILYTKDLRFIKEYRVPTMASMFMGFLVDSNGRIVLYAEAGSISGHYFTVLTEAFESLRVFGKTKTPLPGLTLKRKSRFDVVDQHVVIPEENGIWCSFKDRYDLRYYKNEKLAVEIKAPKDYFRKVERDVQGPNNEKYTSVNFLDSSIQLARYKNLLYHFVRLNKNYYCDIFDLTSYRLLHRIKLDRNYGRVTHFKENIFYGYTYQLSEEDEDKDVVLCKLEL